MTKKAKDEEESRSARLQIDRPADWIFDLDNTLYPPESALFEQIDLRMSRYVAELLDVDHETARRVQKDYFVTYGTTLRGLMDRHGVAPEHFLERVHDIDVSPIAPDPDLAEALAGLDGRRLVFTNGSASHAERVLRRLGIEPLIDGVFDIAAADYRPKPTPATYDRFVARFSVEPERAVMVEDMARNLAPAAALGMTTVWVKTSYQWGAVDHDAASVDIEIDDLRGFLKAQGGGVPRTG